MSLAAPPPVTDPLLGTAGLASISPLDAIRMLRSAGGALLAQATLHGELLLVEWADEQRRLLQMLAATLLGFACLLCAMISVGALALALGWETPYRVPLVIGLIALYTLGASLAWRRIKALSALGDQSFAASRAEFAADAALLRSRL